MTMTLHPNIKNRLDEVERIEIETQEPGVRIIDKTGPLHNFADRDHCLQYMIAVGLIFGELTADHYTDETAADPRIDVLRAKMHVQENESFTKDYYDLDKRAIGNSIKVFFNDGSSSKRIEVQYPIGHRVRRQEGIPLMIQKFNNSLPIVFDPQQSETIKAAFDSGSQLDSMSVSDFMELVSKQPASIDQMVV